MLSAITSKVVLVDNNKVNVLADGSRVSKALADKMALVGSNPADNHKYNQHIPPSILSCFRHDHRAREDFLFATHPQTYGTIWVDSLLERCCNNRDRQ